MVPNSLILVILGVAYFPGSFGYFLRSPWLKRRLVNREFLVLGSTSALMFLMIVLALLGVHIVWLSWVLLITAIIVLVSAILLFRAALAHVKAREREIAEARARGH